MGNETPFLGGGSDAQSLVEGARQRGKGSGGSKSVWPARALGPPDLIAGPLCLPSLPFILRAGGEAASDLGTACALRQPLSPSLSQPSLCSGGPSLDPATSPL